MVPSAISVCNLTAGAAGSTTITSAGTAVSGGTGLFDNAASATSTGWTGWNASSGAAGPTQDMAGSVASGTGAMPSFTGTGTAVSSSWGGWSVGNETSSAPNTLQTGIATASTSGNETANSTLGVFGGTNTSVSHSSLENHL